jgi:hypothetical protein
VIYDILFKASAETMITITADPKHLGARIGVLSVPLATSSHAREGSRLVSMDPLAACRQQRHL